MKILSGFIVAWGLAATLAAQGPEAGVADRFDELDAALWDQVRIAAEYANVQCQLLPSVKMFNELAERNRLRIEARHPGYTVNDKGDGLKVKK